MSAYNSRRYNNANRRSGQIGNRIQVQEEHETLRKKWDMHEGRLQKHWDSLNQDQRRECILKLADGQNIPRHPEASTHGGVLSSLVPEWNLRDLSDPEEDCLLDMMANRAIPDLIDQYKLNDKTFIERRMETHELRVNQSFRDAYIMFIDSDQYGQAVQIPRSKMAEIEWAFRFGNMLPKGIGEMILCRQLFLLQRLNDFANIILGDAGVTNIPRKRREVDQLDLAWLTRTILSNKNSTQLANTPVAPTADEAVDALEQGIQMLQVPGSRGAASQIRPAAKKIKEEPLPDPKDLIRDREIAHEAYLDSLASQPGMLAREVAAFFSSRPELIADEKGRSLPLKADMHASGAVLDAAQSAIKAAAISSYADQLLGRLEDAGSDKLRRSIILQELSNVAHLDYVRLQSLLKRQLTRDSKLFKRMSNAVDAVGNPNIKLKGKPQDPETTPQKAHGCIGELFKLYHKTNFEKYGETLPRDAFETMGLLSLSAAVNLSLAQKGPVPSRKKAQFFVTRAQELEAELNRLKADLGPVLTKKALDDGHIDGALERLDEIVAEKVGARLGFLYEDLIQDSFSYLDKQYDHAKANGETDWTALPVEPQEVYEELVESRKQKNKSRSSSRSQLDILPSARESVPAPPPIEVEYESMVETFQNLIGKSESREAVGWAAFNLAMKEL
ncbi:ipa protein [Colletotrichum kahawae]|uniref:Ipa protein n=1 Tax=Colletotrichum kahawae TaxID=34407 RepID=A0AAD9Y5V5_COLKA|nr:ipa protein [Colletotrichum kahawae]